MIIVHGDKIVDIGKANWLVVTATSKGAIRTVVVFDGGTIHMDFIVNFNEIEKSKEEIVNQVVNQLALVKNLDGILPIKKLDRR